MVSEDAITNSFANVKKDIMEVKAELLEISGRQAELHEIILDLKKSLGKGKKRTSKK